MNSAYFRDNREPMTGLVEHYTPPKTNDSECSGCGYSY